MAAAALMAAVSAAGQPAWTDFGGPSKAEPLRGLRYGVEAQVSLSDNQTPLWLNANKHGLGSLEKANGYLRAAVVRPIGEDSARHWAVGYGIDAAITHGHSSRLVVQQAFAELRWLYATLSVGSKERGMELKNDRLSTGPHTLGTNARPVPQVRLSMEDYWALPFGGRWFRIKGHVAYGKATDDAWQRSFTGMESKYSQGALYHSKAGYLKIGNEERFVPLSLELGLEMASVFGGKAYRPNGQGGMDELKGSNSLGSMWRAFLPGGADVGESTYQNAEGNQLGSWVARLNYDAENWRLGLYADKYFEDHSAMFQMDYDGYGEGEDWQVAQRRKYAVYDFKDFLLGAELNIKYGKWLRGLVLEYVHSKYQSGPIYHDHTIIVADHIGGNDDYYNHYIYTGWQHWGQVIGNPLYRSPQYNKDGAIEVENNRFSAWHLGLSSQPLANLDCRLLATYQHGLGTYANPYTKPHHNVSLLLEGNYRMGGGWNVTGALGMDFGGILGRSTGLQLTVAKSGVFDL